MNALETTHLVTLNCFTFILNFLKCAHLSYRMLVIKVYNIFYFLFSKTNPGQNLRLNLTEMDIFGKFDHFI